MEQQRGEMRAKETAANNKETEPSLMLLLLLLHTTAVKLKLKWGEKKSAARKNIKFPYYNSKNSLSCSLNTTDDEISFLGTSARAESLVVGTLI